MSPTAQLSIRLGLIGLATVVLQTAMLSQLSIFGGVPDIAPLVVASVGLLSGVVGGAVTGFWIGLLVDVATMQTLGVSSFSYIVVGYFAGRVRETNRDPGASLLPLAVGAVGTLIALTVFSVLQFLLGVEAPVSLELLRQIVITAPRIARAGWAEAAQRARAAGDDQLESSGAIRFDTTEWEWR